MILIEGKDDMTCKIADSEQFIKELRMVSIYN